MRKKDMLFIEMLHMLFRKSILENGFFSSVEYIKTVIFPAFKHDLKITKKRLFNIMHVLIENNQKGKYVATCQSISVLLFFLCLLSDLSPKIILGVRYIDGKLFSHSWVCCEKYIFDTKKEDFDYIVIKEIK